LKVGFFSELKTGHNDFESGFLNSVFCHFTAEKHHSRPFKLLGNVYLVVLKVGVTGTYVKENEEQPFGFVTRIFKE